MIVLYSKGSKYGELFNEFSFQHLLDSGEFFLSADEAMAEPEPEPEPEVEAKPKGGSKLETAVKETKEALEAVEALKEETSKSSAVKDKKLRSPDKGKAKK